MLQHTERGSDKWWREVARMGTPWLEKRAPDRYLVTFLWRDPAGSESTSALRRVWINISGVTDHHQRAEPQSLSRIAGTDIWFWQIELDAHWRGSYCFIPSADADDYRAGDGPATLPALRLWWRSRFAAATADPLNPLPAWSNARGHPLSALHLPLAPPQPAWEEFDHAGAEGKLLPPAGRLERHQWHSQRLGNSRTLWVYSTGARHPSQRPLAILLDGQFWARQMPVWGPLARLTRQGLLPEAVYLLIDAIDTERRGRELTCNPEFWLALQEEVLPQLAQWAPFSAEPATKVVAGQSFGGLSAVYAALHWPQQFGCALSLSGSFWWPTRELAPDADAIAAGAQLPRELEQGLGRGHSLRFFLEAGKRERLIRQVNDQMAAALSRQGHRVIYRPIEGGHDALCWRGGLMDGLVALWSDPAAQTGDTSPDMPMDAL